MFYSTDIWISIRLYLVYNKRCWYQATILITFQNKKSVDENEMAGQQATDTRSHCGFIIIIIQTNQGQKNIYSDSDSSASAFCIL